MNLQEEIEKLIIGICGNDNCIRIFERGFYFNYQGLNFLFSSRGNLVRFSIPLLLVDSNYDKLLAAIDQTNSMFTTRAVLHKDGVSISCQHTYVADSDDLALMVAHMVDMLKKAAEHILGVLKKK